MINDTDIDTVDQEQIVETQIEKIAVLETLNKDEIKEIRSTRKQLRNSLSTAVMQRNQIDRNIKAIQSLLSAFDKIVIEKQ